MILARIKWTGKTYQWRIERCILWSYRKKEMRCSFPFKHRYKWDLASEGVLPSPDSSVQASVFAVAFSSIITIWTPNPPIISSWEPGLPLAKGKALGALAVSIPERTILMHLDLPLSPHSRPIITQQGLHVSCVWMASVRVHSVSKRERMVQGLPGFSRSIVGTKRFG